MKKNHETGIVSRIYGAYYSVIPLNDLNAEYRGKLRGKLRLEKGREGNIRTRHLIMVGDHVTYTRTGRSESEDEINIESLIKRKNAVFRAGAYQAQALGANLDRAVLISSLAQPDANFRFLDRFLAGCYSSGVTPMVLFTKTDLLEDDENAEEKILMTDYYKSLGYPVFLASLTDLDQSGDYARLEEILSQGVTLMVGQSGTGKSTLLNRLTGKKIQKIGEISSSSNKGRHTTTNSLLVTHRDGVAMFIDTPGIKEWGIMHLNRVEVIESFPELQPSLEHCKFANCEHQPEDSHCAVQKEIKENLNYYRAREAEEEAIEPENPIDMDRLASLEAMLQSLEYADRVRTGDYIKSTGRFNT